MSVNLYKPHVLVLPEDAANRQLANACVDGATGLWAHPMLQHNQPEIERLIRNVKPFLFEA